MKRCLLPLLLLWLCAFAPALPAADDSSLRGMDRFLITAAGKVDGQDTFLEFRLSGLPLPSMDEYLAYARTRAVMRGLAAPKDVQAYQVGFGVAMIGLNQAAAHAAP